MEYTKKHKNLIAELFKKTEMLEEANILRCEGGVWCNIYNLGGSHRRIGDGYRHLSRSTFDIPLRKRRKLMLEMLEYETRHKTGKCK